MPKPLSRREFLQVAAAAGASLLPAYGVLARAAGPARGEAPDGSPPRVILISLDSLDPRYLSLDRHGNPGGRPGNRLLPHVGAFLDSGLHVKDIRCHMPSVTDTNHLNAVAGTHAGQTGVYFVSAQFFDWEPDGGPDIRPTSLSLAKGPDGGPVDTLFNAWKRRWPKSRTFYISGKEWVASMFDGPDTGVDLLVGGTRHPDYLPAPVPHPFYDPPGDPDARTDPETRHQVFLSRVAFEANPDRFPPDQWIVDAALEVLAREKPDFGVILLAQMDDLQHELGAGWDPGEFEEKPLPLYGNALVSRLSDTVCREGILDGLREADREFGRLVAGIRALPAYEDALLVLYSDHGHITHRNVDRLFDMVAKSAFYTGPGTGSPGLDPVAVLNRAGLLTKAEKERRGFMALCATSLGAMHWRGRDMGERIQKARAAKGALLAHRIRDPEKRAWECPWQVLDLADMEAGVPGVSAPGELFHPVFAHENRAGHLHWPDLFLFARNNWQFPAQAGLAANVGVALPSFMVPLIAPFAAMNGGHGAPDTQGIVLGFQGPDVLPGREVGDPGLSRDHRLSDLAATLAAYFGLALKTRGWGVDRSDWLA